MSYTVERSSSCSLHAPLHKKIQKRIERLLETFADTRGVVSTEFPYRPVLNLQFWIADVAYVPQADWDALPSDEDPVLFAAVTSNKSLRLSAKKSLHSRPVHRSSG
jgi:hypothetical protein